MVFLLLSYCCLSYSQSLTYYNGGKALLDQYCTGCHKQDGYAPFSLESYKAVIKNKETIKNVVASGYMPPWKPDPAFSHFQNERVMSEDDKSKLLAWLNEGCAEGERSSISAGPGPYNSAIAPKADLVIKLPFTVNIVPSSVDTNVYLEVPYEIERDTFISYYDFVSNISSGFRTGIHHIFFAIEDVERKESAGYISQFYPHDYWNGRQFNRRTYTTEFLTFAGGWVPGQAAVGMPDGIGFKIPKKGMLIYMVHYGPAPKAFKNQFELRLTYAKKPVERIAEGRRYGTLGGIVEPYPPLVIPPDTIMKFTLNTVIDKDFTVLALSPHMHLLGKSFKVWLVEPNGDTLPVIHIKNWDFNWQGYYFPPHPLKFDSGATFMAEVIYDNTKYNIRNPNSPPQLVRYGQRTRDEMLEFNLYGVPYRKGDELIEMHY